MAEENTELETAIRRLRVNSKMYVQYKNALDRLTVDIEVGIVEAFRAGADPSDVIAVTPWTGAWIRQIVRKYGIPPARRGTKPKKKTQGGIKDHAQK
jgi:hypothetical protein